MVVCLSQQYRDVQVEEENTEAAKATQDII
jgi:hypothetical protein